MIRKMFFAALGACSIASLAQANVVLFSSNFDGEALTQGGGTYTTNYTAFSDWNVTAGTVDVLVLPNQFIGNPGGYGAGQPASSVVVDLDGSSPDLGIGEITTTQSFNLVAGTTYKLSVAYGNAFGDVNGFEFGLTGVNSQAISNVGYAAFDVATLQFTAAADASASIFVRGTGFADKNGVLVDNVSLVAVASVPEPASLLAVGGSLLGLVGLKRVLAPAKA